MLSNINLELYRDNHKEGVSFFSQLLSAITGFTPAKNEPHHGGKRTRISEIELNQAG